MNEIAMGHSNKGFTEKGGKMRDVLARHVDSGKIPGLVAPVSRNGRRTLKRSVRCAMTVALDAPGHDLPDGVHFQDGRSRGGDGPARRVQAASG